MGDAELLASSPFDEDLDSELAAQPQKRSLPGPTLYLCAGLILVAGFLAGVQAQKWSSDDSGSGPSGAGGPAAAGGYGSRTGGRAPGGYGGMPGMPGMGGQPGGTNGQGAGGTGNGQGAGGSGASGQGPGGMAGGSAGGATIGTITKIEGSTIYLRTTSGQTVKVKTSGATKVRVTKDGKLKDLGSGTTVIVRGSTGQDGTVTATTVNQGTGR
ncbi:hypothetical protein [Actinomadura fibrosa]|uniref:DUF5666 domain-containing protein n=1 Tax=Actinomadura fibrosa TaxID=111802 RepID=A0ABW2XJW0_9ACTN|nr:hypothetical protein [Actinomadura fibrosa]